MWTFWLSSCLEKFPDLVLTHLSILLDGVSAIDALELNDNIVHFPRPNFTNAKEDVFCYDPVILDETSQSWLEALPIDSCTCRMSIFLEHHDLKHEALEINDQELQRNLSQWGQEIQKKKEEYPYLGEGSIIT